MGAVLRYLTGIGVLRVFGATPMPLGVLAVNVLGSLLAGLFVAFAVQRGVMHLSPLIVTGVLGGFTTFSAFSLEAVALYERGALGLATIYVLANVILSLAALMLGLALGRSLA